MTTPLHYLPHEIDAVVQSIQDERSRKVISNLWSTYEILMNDYNDLESYCESVEAHKADIEKELDLAYKEIGEKDDKIYELESTIEAIEELIKA